MQPTAEMRPLTSDRPAPNAGFHAPPLPIPAPPPPHAPLEITEFAPQPLEIAEVDTEGRLPPFPHLFWHPLRAIAWIVRGLFGLASLIFLLAVIAAIPIVNFLALGYLLEVEGRIGRTGRLRSAFPLIGLAPRIGSIALGVWLWTLPLRLLASLAADASLIDPSAPPALFLRVAVPALWALVSIHLVLALARGGSLGCFLRPLKNILWLIKRLSAGDYIVTASRHIQDFVTRLKLRHHFLLGVKGFAGAFAWLLIPTLFYAFARTSDGGPVLITFLGGLLLTVVFAWVPFLQAHFAAEQRLGAFRELGTVRRLFAHAPFAWLFAIIIVYALALPLYLFKVALPPSDAMWFITLVFIVSIYPARVVTGWAYHRAVRKQRAGKKSWFVTRLATRVVMWPLLAFYVFVLFFTQFIGAEGKLELFQHHAFLLPWPMFVGS